jgi:nicotinate phosphoribosyltransferase
VWRRTAAQGRFASDTLGLVTDHPDGEPLLVPVMRAGRRVDPAEAPVVARERARQQLAGLPDMLRGLDEQPDYEVEVTSAVRELAAEVDRAT